MKGGVSAAGIVVVAGMAVAGALEAPVVVDLRLHGDAEAVPVELIFARSSGEADAVVVECSAPGTERVMLPAGQPWSVEAVAEGYRIDGAVVVPQAGTAEMTTLHLWPTGVLHGAVEMHDEDEAMPEELSVRFCASPDGPETEDFPAGEIRCPVDDGEWHCAVPAGRLDLRLRATGFVSHFFWSAEVAAGASSALGTVQLRRGASVTGWVSATTSKPDLGACTLELKTLTADPLVPPDEQQRLRGLALDTGATPRGFFHFEGVPPGMYTLTARLAGMAQSRFSPVQVFENAQTSLVEPILLAPPATLRIELEPGADPWGRDWRAGLLAYGPHPSRLQEIGSEAPASGGIVEWSGLARGRYAVTIGDESGSSWAKQEVMVDRDSVLERLEIPVVAVEGTVRHGSEPLAATIWFGGRSGARSIRFASDDEGRFGGYLPSAGRWLITVASEEAELERRFQRVEVEYEQGGTAEIELVIPATVVEGEVVDESGLLAPGTRVTLTSSDLLELPAVVAADDSGRFRHQGFAPGTVTLQAALGDLCSDPVQRELVEEAPVSVRLLLRATQEVKGTVAGPHGPVPGCSIAAFPIGHRSEAAQTSATTDVSGSFSLRVPRWADRLNMLVMAPGFGMRILRVEVAPELSIPVQQGSGALVLHLDALRGQPLLPVLVADGGALAPLPPLLRWAQMNGVQARSGATVTIPSMAPGSYSLCVLTLDEATAAFLGGNPGGACSDLGLLVPGGELVLSVPEQAKQ